MVEGAQRMIGASLKFPFRNAASRTNSLSEEQIKLEEPARTEELINTAKHMTGISQPTELITIKY